MPEHVKIFLKEIKNDVSHFNLYKTEEERIEYATGCLEPLVKHGSASHQLKLAIIFVLKYLECCKKKKYCDEKVDAEKIILYLKKFYRAIQINQCLEKLISTSCVKKESDGSLAIHY